MGDSGQLFERPEVDIAMARIATMFRSFSPADAGRPSLENVIDLVLLDR
jgi:hypothetical protein